MAGLSWDDGTHRLAELGLWCQSRLEEGGAASPEAPLLGFEFATSFRRLGAALQSKDPVPGD